MKSELVKGDSLKVLKKYDDNSIDLLCTDPPYGYSFMGRDWDKTLPPKEIFEECFRVLKPGSMAFVMSAPRSDVQYRMAEMLEKVGFRIDYTPIYWTYASGFPKAMNMSKMIDKRGAANQEDLNKWKTWFKEQLDKSKKSNKQINDECGFTATSYCKMDGKDNWTIAFPSKEKWEKIKEVMDLPNDDEYKILEKYTNDRDEFVKQRGHIETTGNLHISDEKKSIKFSGKQLSDNPYSAEAKRFDGAYGGFQPKPAVEVVIVAMKPMEEKGFMAQALKNGKAVTWLDDCRIPFAGTSDEEQYESDKKGFTERSSIEEGSVYADEYGGTYNYGFKKPKKTKRKPREENTVFKTSGFKSEDNDTAEASPLGRFAANLLVSDDVMNDGVLRKAGKYKGEGSKSGGIWRESTGEPAGREYGDEGSFSRYYSLDAWWEDRVQKLPDEVKRTFPFLIVPKPSKSEKNMGLDKFNKQQKIFNGQSDKSSKDMKGVEKKFTTQPSSNIHPTVKQTTLMSYLVTLGSRKGDVVLDPFAGSGTTGISCVFSERNYLLIEREKEYFDILKARIKKAENPAGIVQHEWF